MFKLHLPAKTCIMGKFSSLGKCGVQNGDHTCNRVVLWLIISNIQVLSSLAGVNYCSTPWSSVDSSFVAWGITSDGSYLTLALWSVLSRKFLAIAIDFSENSLIPL